MEAMIRSYSAHHSGRIGANIGYDESLAHLIYAGADTLAIPSRFEPCGLTQMIAMRYGTLPVARATGGLVDTIQHDRSGFLFENANATGFLWASGIARGAYEAKDHWQMMIQTAMRQDFSWARSAQRYLDLYKTIAKIDS